MSFQDNVFIISIPGFKGPRIPSSLNKPGQNPEQIPPMQGKLIIKQIKNQALKELQEVGVSTIFSKQKCRSIE